MSEETKTVSRKLDTEEVNEVVAEIQFQHQLEIDFLTKSKLESDTEVIESLREDAYLANLIKIKQAKRLTRKQYVEYEVDKQTCCGYNDLNIPEWEDYQ
jgi:hypothetical protein